jgi:hypothetical protein
MQTVGRFPGAAGSSRFAYFYSGGTGISPPPPGNWTVLPLAINNPAVPGYGFLGGTNHGVMFLVTDANNLAVVNLDTQALTNLGHP